MVKTIPRGHTVPGNGNDPGGDAQIWRNPYAGRRRLLTPAESVLLLGVACKIPVAREIGRGKNSKGQGLYGGLMAYTEKP